MSFVLNCLKALAKKVGAYFAIFFLNITQNDNKLQKKWNSITLTKIISDKIKRCQLR